VAQTRAQSGVNDSARSGGESSGSGVVAALPKLCGGKPAPQSKDKNVDDEYQCVCGKWRLSSRRKFQTFPEPCGRQLISSETTNWTELSITNNQGTFCSAAEASRAYTEYRPRVEAARSCTPKGSTPRVIPKTCVVDSRSSTIANDYEKCAKGSERSHSDRRSMTSTKSKGFVMCALGSWDYEVTSTSGSCEWNCKGDQLDEKCPKSESEVYN